jgi:hypothetical protein
LFDRGGEAELRVRAGFACNRIGNSVATDTISTALDAAFEGRSRAAPMALDETLRRCEESGRSVFLFGGDATGIRMLRERAGADYPRLRIAGICDADFSGPAGGAIIGHIASCKPDVLVVDLPPARHRALLAEVVAAGLRFTLVNRPGSFIRSAGKRGGSVLPGTTRSPLSRAAANVASLARFASIVFRQAWRSHGGPASARGQADPGGRR